MNIASAAVITRNIAVALMVLGLAGNAFAGDLAADRLVAAFQVWLKEERIANGSIVALREGTEIARWSGGTYAADLPVPVASLSKAITGVCIAKLVSAKKLRFSSKMAEILAAQFAKKPPRDTRVASITVAHLLTHTSGIGLDPSQGARLRVFRPFDRPSMKRQLNIALTADLVAAPGESYAYNNMNFTALGLIIESVTGRSYEEACRNLVLAPLGITTARLNPSWRVMGAFGGWLISAADYARFARYFESPNRVQLNFRGWPRHPLAGGAESSLGVFMRANGNDYNFWHYGTWRSSDPPASFGAVFMVWNGGMSVVAAFSPTAGDQALARLDQRLWDASFP